jgi:hypothetical protein
MTTAHTFEVFTEMHGLKKSESASAQTCKTTSYPWIIVRFSTKNIIQSCPLLLGCNIRTDAKVVFRRNGQRFRIFGTKCRSYCLDVRETESVRDQNSEERSSVYRDM